MTKYICKYCKKEFENRQSLAGHYNHCKFKPGFNEEEYKKYVINNLKAANEKRKQINIEKRKKYKYKFICKHCGKEYELELTKTQYEKGKYTKFCCRSCANSRVLSQDTKNKISESLAKNRKTKTKHYKLKERICKVCGKHYYHIPHTGTTKLMCSKECSHYYKKHRKEFLTKETIEKLSIAGRKGIAAQGDNRRSKNEKEFCLLCEKYFNNVDHNKPIFNGWDADILLYDYKIAILWNGPWHYKEISQTTTLKQIQNRDKIKLKEIKNCGWISYIIKDYGKHNKDFVQEQFEIFKEYINTYKYIAGW